MDKSLIDSLKIENIPIELVNFITHNHLGKKKSLMEGCQVKLQERTKDVLDSIKVQNGMSSISNTIDLLISTVVMYQINEVDDPSQLSIYDALMKKDIKKDGYTRPVNVNGREFYSVSKCANQYRVSRQTVINRINNLNNPKFRKWNYSDEDLDVKYDKRRID